MSRPGEGEGFAAAVPPGSPWRNAVSPAVFLTVSTIRPIRLARRVAAPLWVGAGDRDVSVPARSVRRLAELAPRGELQRYPYDHFGAFAGDRPARVAADHAAFLRRAGVVLSAGPASG